jgi:hypothetical protein
LLGEAIEQHGATIAREVLAAELTVAAAGEDLPRPPLASLRVGSARAQAHMAALDH